MLFLYIKFINNKPVDILAQVHCRIECLLTPSASIQRGFMVNIYSQALQLLDLNDAQRNLVL